MALSEDEKKFLDQLRQDLIKRTGPEVAELNKVVNEIDLTGISADDLESLTDKQFTLGVNFNEIDTSGNSTGGRFTSFDMNFLAPGAINEKELKAKLSNQSLLKGRVIDIVDTQSGTMAIIQEIKINADIEDVIERKTRSQGTNLQMVNLSSEVDKQSVDSKPIKSRFLEG